MTTTADASATADTSAAPGTTAADLLDRVRELRPLLEKNAARGEEDRRVAEESITALTEAGAFRLTQPRRYGGYEAPMRTVLDVCAAVAEGDGGTSWVVSLNAVCQFMAALYPERAQDEVWGDNPDAKVSGVLTTTSESVRVEGGHRVTGRWYYNSGSWHADWAVLGVPVTDADGEVVDHGLALVPFTDLDIEETWFVAGMRSSGSNCLVGKDVFVPDHRMISVPPTIEGAHLPDHPDSPLYRSPFVPFLALILAGPQLGMGRRVLEIVTEKASRKAISLTSYTTQADSVGFQLQLAEAAQLIDTAHLHAYRAADDIDRAAAAGVYPGPKERARVRADTSWVMRHITQAIDLLMFAHGSGGFAEVSPLQRMWRDSAVAARHAVALPAVGLKVYGKALLDREDRITPLI
ncbi:acyl-CoA dehydrogenase family protein [Nocardiopsis protaetiae]|uniref:acyl-CoA dehydrogenase family protein n=1 Tax=Nocardiopsis protaetiae TaxID=3382270 RepID=UPI00387B5982